MQYMRRRRKQAWVPGNFMQFSTRSVYYVIFAPKFIGGVFLISNCLLACITVIFAEGYGGFPLPWDFQFWDFGITFRP